jgi:RNA polymerase sigma-70 factor (ECF subfamily)
MVLRETVADFRKISDEELVRHFAASGDVAYFTEFHRRHETKVLASCRAFLRNPVDAEDAAQEAFLRVYKNPHGFDDGSAVGWLLRIARNVCIDWWRKTRSETLCGDVPEVPEALHKEPDKILRQLLWSRVLMIVASLPFEPRTCTESILKGYSYEEIAGQIRGSTEDVRRHLQNAKREIRRRTGLQQ